MHIRIAAVLALAAAAILCPVGHASGPEPELWLQEDATNTNVSGVTGAKTTVEITSTPEASAMRGIEIAEKSDDPCDVTSLGGLLNDPSEGDLAEFTHKCDGYAGGERRASFTGRTFVSGLRVCLDRDHEKVKGVELKGRLANADGSLSAASGRPSLERTNCRDWMDWAECAGGEIATGFNLHFEGGSGRRSLKGIGLVCRTLAARAADLGPQYSGGISETGRAGPGGEISRVLKPGNADDNKLTAIAWAEKSDNPCLVTAKGETLSTQVRRVNDSYDGCGGDTREGSHREAGRGEGYAYPATGVRVCVKNGKVKGIELEYTDINLSRRFTYEGGADTQPNCRVGDREWTDWVHCPNGQAAIGLRAFFDGVRGPVSLTGIKLLCRTLE